MSPSSKLASVLVVLSFIAVVSYQAINSDKPKVVRTGVLVESVVIELDEPGRAEFFERLKEFAEQHHFVLIAFSNEFSRGDRQLTQVWYTHSDGVVMFSNDIIERGRMWTSFYNDQSGSGTAEARQFALDFKAYINSLNRINE